MPDDENGLSECEFCAHRRYWHDENACARIECRCKGFVEPESVDIRQGDDA